MPISFDNSHIRRQDRLLDAASAHRLLNEGEWGTLSMVDAEGRAYAVPVNFVYDGNSAIYIHCAPEGRKMRAIMAHPDISFCVVGNVQLQPGLFTTEYESIIIEGKARIVHNDDERREALRRFIAKYSPLYIDKGVTYAEKSFHRVSILRIETDCMSGKQKILHPTPNPTNT